MLLVSFTAGLKRYVSYNMTVISSLGDVNLRCRYISFLSRRPAITATNNDSEQEAIINQHLFQ